MKVDFKSNTNKFISQLKKEINLKLNTSAQKAVEFNKNRFTTGLDVDGNPFVQRRYKDEGRAVLIRTGQLRNSIRFQRLSGLGFELFAGDDSKIKYAKIHNEGGTIPITAKSRAFFWAMYAKTKKEFWKYLALKRSPIKIPKRNFFGLNKNEIKELEKIIASINLRF